MAFKLVEARWLSLVFAVYFSPRLLLSHPWLKSDEKATCGWRGEEGVGGGERRG